MKYLFLILLLSSCASYMGSDFAPKTQEECRIYFNLEPGSTHTACNRLGDYYE